jgi:GcrA cell cycle regulator
LIAHRNDGLSGSMIAARLGMTRNQVIGKLCRMGKNLISTQRMPQRARIRQKPPAPRPKHARLTPRAARAAQCAPSPVAIPHDQVWLPLPGSSPVALLALETNHCRWPVTAVSGQFCGCNKVPGLPYCAAHAKRATRTPDAKPVWAYNVPALGRAVEANAAEFLKETA